MEHLAESYFAALEKELHYPEICFNTVYIGGGTPSVLDSGYYGKILAGINLSPDAEVTIEVNPGTVNAKYLETLRKIGINRLSIGVQSFDNRILKGINRPYSAEDVFSTVKTAQDSGFDNISIDLMYGLPCQTIILWKETLIQAARLDIKHISAYGLKIEEDTEFFHTPPKNLPEEDEIVQMYLSTIEILENNGFQHYEISNFAQPGFQSRHNLAYWECREYLGVGLGAHSYTNGIRSSNTEVLKEYIFNPFQKTVTHRLTDTEKQEEYIFLGLRLRKGIDISLLRGNYKDVIAKYTNAGLLSLENGRLKLTQRGILLSNEVLSGFIQLKYSKYGVK